MYRVLGLLLAALALFVMPAAAQDQVSLGVAAAEAAVDPMSGQPVINVTLDEDGRKALADFTAAHQGQVVEVLVNDQVLLAPTIMEPLTAGVFVISGSYTVSEIDALAEVIGTAVAPLAIRVPPEAKSK